MKSIARLILWLALLTVMGVLLALLEKFELWWQDLIILFILWILFLYPGARATQEWLIEKLEEIE